MKDTDMITIRITVDIFYDIPKRDVPSYVTPVGMEKLIEESFRDYEQVKVRAGKPMTLKDFSADGLLGIEPSEVAINVILAV